MLYCSLHVSRVLRTCLPAHAVPEQSRHMAGQFSEPVGLSKRKLSRSRWGISPAESFSAVALSPCSWRWQLSASPFTERAITKEPFPPQPGMVFYHMRSKASDHAPGFYWHVPFVNEYFNTLTNLQNLAKVLKRVSEIGDFVKRLLQILLFHPKLFCASWKLSLGWPIQIPGHICWFAERKKRKIDASSDFFSQKSVMHDRWLEL